jgi:xylan 1,4-beta-xylosidase
MKIVQCLGLIGQISIYCLTVGNALALAGTVQVDAGTNFTGDANYINDGIEDIGQIQGYCSSVGRQGVNGVGTETGKYMTRLGTNFMRQINVDRGASSVTTNPSTGQKEFVPGTPTDGAPKLEDVLKDARTYGYKPHIIVGQAKPNYLSGDAWTWTAATWEQYKEYAYRYVRYVVSEYEGSGFATSLFEVGNEPSIAPVKDIWTQKPASDGTVTDEQRYQHTKTLYAIWQEAVTKVASETPNRQVWVAGPAEGPNYVTSFNWPGRFIDDVAANNWRLNYYTFHAYGDTAAVGNSAPHPDFGYLKDYLQSIRNKLASVGRGNTWVAITEWGGSGATYDPQLSRINYTHEAASWTVAFARDMVHKGLKDAVLLLMRDNKDGSQTEGAANDVSFIHLKNGVEYPKPIYNACRMFGLLPGTRKQAILPSAQTNLVAIASSNQNSVGTVVANYKYLFDFPNKNFTDQSNPDEPVTVQFSNLPFSGRAIVQRYLIDANTSNLAKYLDAGQTPDPNGTQLQKLPDTEVDVVNGSVTLPQVTLGKAATSLWVIQSKNTVANGNYRITARHSLKSLDVENASQLDNAKVQQFGYGGSSNQQWEIANAGNNYYKITSKHTANAGSPKVLGVQSSSASCGTTVVQQTDSGGSNQRWQLVPMGGGFYKIAPQSAIDAGQNLVLDINGASGLNGTPAIMCGYGNMDNQMFRLDEP